MAKRGNGEGTISKRKNGTWCAAISNGVNPETGKPKRVFFYGRTRQEVAEKLNKAIHNQSLGTFVTPSKIIFSSWLDIWLFEYKRLSVRPSTFESYEYLTRVHIKPTLGKLYLKDIRSDHLQKLYNEKYRSGKIDGTGGLSSRTVRYIHNIICEALSCAVKNNLLNNNVADTDIITLPRKEKREIRILTIDEQKAFLEALDGERLRAAFILALGSGIRQGELLALRWQEDIDLKQGIININRTVKRVKTFDGKSKNKTKIIFQEPKTKSSKRTIPLPAGVIQEIKEHRKRQLEEKLLAGEVYYDNDLVFCNELGKITEPATLTRIYKRILKKAELSDMNLHALRHTYATRLLEANEHPKVVQELLGHSDISMTLNTYSHVMPELKKAAADKINFLFVGEK